MPQDVNELINTTVKTATDLARKGVEELEKAKSRLDIRPANVMLLPDGLGNVYKNLRWGINAPGQDFIEEVPIIILTEYQSNSGPVLEDLLYTIKVGEGVLDAFAGKKVNPYLSIYNGVLTGNLYQLPFFSTYNHTMSSNWGDPDAANTPTAIGRDAVGKIGGIFQRGLVEKRRVWKGATPASYSFSFTLYNTFDPMADIPKNLQFIRTLIHNNLADRTSFATLLPPCFYKLEIPGVRYAPVVSLDGIDVQNIGQVNRRTMALPNEAGEYKDVSVNIPDAWEITISVSEIHNESRDIYNGTFGSASKITIIDEERAKPSENINFKKISTGRVGG